MCTTRSSAQDRQLEKSLVDFPKAGVAQYLHTTNCERSTGAGSVKKTVVNLPSGWERGTFAVLSRIVVV
jgi:hypothetical protein